MPDCVGFLLGFKARKQAHSELCNCCNNAEGEQKDQQDDIFFDRNRLSGELFSHRSEKAPMVKFQPDRSVLGKRFVSMVFEGVRHRR